MRQIYSPDVLLPWWMLRAFPWLAGIENEPLYLRLSGKRFCRREWWRWRGIPVEVRTNEPWWSALVILLCCLYMAGGAVMTCILVPLFAVACVVQLANVGCILRVHNFAANFGTQPWGEALWLTSLHRDDYARALFAATLETRARAYQRAAIVVWLVAALYLGISPDSPDSGSASAIRGFFIATLAAFVAFWELTAMAALNLAFAMQDAERLLKSASAARISLNSAMTWSAFHIPALVMFYFGFVGRNGNNLSLHAGGFLLSAAATLPLWHIAGKTLSSCEGNLGRCLAFCFERK